MGGVVNVITKNPPEGLSFETRMEIGSWHTKSSLLKIGGYGFLISGLIEKSDGYRFNTDYDGEDINIKYGHKFFDRHRVKLNLGYHKAMKGSFGRKPGEPWRFPWWERARLDLIYSFSSLFEIRYYRNLWDNLLVCYKDTTLMNERWRSHHHNQNNGIEGIFNGRIQKNNIAIGLNLKEDKMETTNEGKADERIKGGFIQWVYRPVDRINLSIGSRYDNHSSSGEKFNYNIGLSYIPMENLCFRTNYGTAMRFPALRETHGDTTTPANPNLVPEESENFEIGVDLSKVQITYFNSRARNLIQKDTSGKFENIENARMRGVEASVNFEIGKWSRCFFNYTRLDAINQKTGKLLESSPRNKLSCGYIIKPQEGIKLALSINYTGSMEKNEQTLSPYTLLSGNISYHIFGGELYLGVNNLLNERHKLENGIEAPGREWRAGIDVGR
jgi:outer membrane cobalamin receptor